MYYKHIIRKLWHLSACELLWILPYSSEDIHQSFSLIEKYLFCPKDVVTRKSFTSSVFRNFTLLSKYLPQVLLYFLQHSPLGLGKLWQNPVTVALKTSIKVISPRMPTKLMLLIVTRQIVNCSFPFFTLLSFFLFFKDPSSACYICYKWRSASSLPSLSTQLSLSDYGFRSVRLVDCFSSMTGQCSRSEPHPT